MSTWTCKHLSFQKGEVEGEAAPMKLERAWFLSEREKSEG